MAVARQRIQARYFLNVWREKVAARPNELLVQSENGSIHIFWLAISYRTYWVMVSVLVPWYPASLRKTNRFLSVSQGGTGPGL